MPSSSSTPKLPLWIFFATDAIFVGAAVWIARESQHPLPEMTALAIAGCVIAGAIAGLVPLVVYYERQKNETLDDRQRALEALARTVSSSAEQISIAAGGLHEIADIAQKNLKHAEQLPHKLQEKIAEFQSQLANANDAEREELEKELEELRAGETERLQSTSDKIARTVAELVKLEAATQSHMTAANDALAKLSFSAAGAIGKAQVAAEQAFNQARLEASRGVGEASGKALTALETARHDAITDITRHFDEQMARFREASAGLAALVERMENATSRSSAGGPGTLLAGSTTSTAEPVAWSAPLEPAAMTAVALAETTPAPVPLPSAADVSPVEASSSPADSPVPPPAVLEPDSAPASDTGAKSEVGGEVPPPAAAAPTPKRSRKKSEPKAEVVKTDAGASQDEPAPTDSTLTEPAPTASEPAPEPGPTFEPLNAGGPPAVHDVPAQAEAPAPAASPDAPGPETVTAEPAAAPEVESAADDEPGQSKASRNGHTEAPPVEAPRPRRRGARAQDDQPGLGLDLGEFEGRPAPTVESVLSSDGATRLIVTAYIGIGNRLFIRGEGPGLSWDKGLPLQFVSIGKWRWETNDATAPVKFKLLKNDEHECVGLGTLTLQPAHQNEVTAAF